MVWIWWAVAVGLGSLLASSLVIGVLIISMPVDYFRHRRPPPGTWRDRHPVLRFSLLVAKNVLGAALVIMGVFLSLPMVMGQGLLTILIGISLLNFPGKRQLELRIVRVPAVLRTINWIRAWAGRPPLDVPQRTRKRRGDKQAGA